jgi:hypothetical protein
MERFSGLFSEPCPLRLFAGLGFNRIPLAEELQIAADWLKALRRKPLRDRPSIEIQGRCESERWFFRGRSKGDDGHFGVVNVAGVNAILKEVLCRRLGIASTSSLLGPIPFFLSS